MIPFLNFARQTMRENFASIGQKNLGSIANDLANN